MSAAPVGARIAPVALSAVSGLCGLGYELLLIRWLHTAVGHTVAVTAATVATFLAGIALGALVAHRVAPRLALVEVGGAVVAGAIAAFMTISGVAGLGDLVAAGGVPAAVLTAVVLALPLAVLSGIAVPAYTLRARAQGVESGRAFRWVYVVYNAVSALAVVFLETAIVPDIGLRYGFLALALINLALAAAVAVLPRLAGENAAPRGRRNLAWRAGTVFAIGIAGGVAQVASLKVANLLFGYFAEHAAFAIALSLFGLALGGLIAAWRASGVYLAVVGCAGSLLVWAQATALWAWAAPQLVGADPALIVAVKLAILAGMLLAPLALVGASIPLALAGAGPDPAAPGRLLAAAAAGNVIGALATVFGGYALLGTAGLLGVAVAGAGLAAGLGGYRLAAGLALALSVTVASVQPPDFHRPTGQYPDGRAVDTPIDVERVIRRYDKTAAVVSMRDMRRIVIEGRFSTRINDRGISRLEFLKGVVPLAYARNLDRAMLVGLGTSHTAAPVVAGFAEAVVVDNSPIPRALAEVVAPEVRRPFRVEQPQAVYRDAVSYVRAGSTPFDAIVFTATQGTGPSTKLWSRETVTAMAARLAPDGIFMTWVSVRNHPPAVLRRTLATLHSVFPACRKVRLMWGYAALVCAKDGEPLAPRKISVPESLYPALDLIGVPVSEVRTLPMHLDRGALRWRPRARPLSLDPPAGERLLTRRNFLPREGRNQATDWFTGMAARTPAQCAAELLLDPDSNCAARTAPWSVCDPEARRLYARSARMWLQDGARGAFVAHVLRLAGQGWGSTARGLLERADRRIPGFDRTPLDRIFADGRISSEEVSRAAAIYEMPDWRRDGFLFGAAGAAVDACD